VRHRFLTCIQRCRTKHATPADAIRLLFNLRFELLHLESEVLDVPRIASSRRRPSATGIRNTAVACPPGDLHRQASRIIISSYQLRCRAMALLSTGFRVQTYTKRRPSVNGESSTSGTLCTAQRPFDSSQSHRRTATNSRSDFKESARHQDPGHSPKHKHYAPTLDKPSSSRRL
jgi:hypothetical protein